MNNTYKFTEAFQFKIASLVLRDPAFIVEYEDVVDPRYFENEYLSHLVRIGKSIFDRIKCPPTKDVVVQAIHDHAKSFRMDASDVDYILEAADKVYNLDLVDIQFVRDKAITFGKRQAFKAAVVDLADMVDKDEDYDRAVTRIQSALQVGMNTNSLGLNFFEQIEHIPALANQADRGFTHKIRTGLPLFDQNTLGGPGRTEIWCVLGLSGIGKTQFLVNVGAHAIYQGIPVAHITVGDLDEEDVGVRYAARMTKLSQYEIIKNDPTYLKRVRKLKRLDYYLRIKYYDPGVVTVDHIDAYLSRLLTRDGIKPGLLILDYPDEFKMDAKTKDNTYVAMGQIYSQIKVLVKKYKCLCWTASQVHRWIPRHKNDVINRGNIADSAKKVHKADGIVSINQTYDESKEGKARLWVDKVRRGKAFFLIPLRVNFSTCVIEQDSVPDEEKSDG